MRVERQIIKSYVQQLKFVDFLPISSIKASNKESFKSDVKKMYSSNIQTTRPEKRNI